MIVKKTDFISGRRLDFEVPEPFPGPQDLGANESLLFPEDVLRSDVSYKDPAFVEDITKRQEYQLLPFYQGLRRVAGSSNPDIWTEIWDWIKNNIWDFLSVGKVGVDPKVLQGIIKVETECGLTEDVKWAYAWYDKRYPLPLGNTWKGYCYYASQWALFPWDVQHYANCCTHCLNQLQNYLQAALSKAAGRPIGDIMDWLKKYGAYVAMGGAGLALILVLATR
ncbi:unnamed protein product, partial [marine sediment metagenome]